MSGADAFTASLRPARSMSSPAGTAAAKLPTSMNATIRDACRGVSRTGARPLDTYSRTGDGHASATPAMNTGKHAVQKQ